MIHSSESVPKTVQCPSAEQMTAPGQLAVSQSLDVRVFVKEYSCKVCSIAREAGLFSGTWIFGKLPP